MDVVLQSTRNGRRLHLHLLREVCGGGTSRGGQYIYIYIYNVIRNDLGIVVDN